MDHPPAPRSSLKRRGALRTLGGLALGLLGAAALRDPVLARAAKDLIEPETHPAPGCQPVTLVLGICPTRDTSLTVSPFTGAPVTIRNDEDNVIFAGFVPASGLVIIGTVESNETHTATVGAVLQPVPFPPGGGDTDFVEMMLKGSGASVPVPFKPKCSREDTGGLTQVSFVKLKPQSGEIRGQLRADCVGTTTVPNVKLELWTTEGQAAPGGPPHPAKRVRKGKTRPDGTFLFTGLDPCQYYALRFVHQGLAREAPGLLAGSPVTTIGTPGEAQTYLINAGLTGPADAICNVLPDPP